MINYSVLEPPLARITEQLAEPVAAEFCAKLGIVEEEGDESAYWMELLIEARLVKEALLKNLLQEANEIVAMVVASIVSARRRKDRS